MRTSKVAKRYAQGLLDFAQESGHTEQIFTEMKDVLKLMKESKDLNRYFQTPFIDFKKKTEAASEIFKSFSPASQNFIKLIIRHGREVYLADIAQEYINRVEDLKGVQRITLTTAIQLSEAIIQDIIESTPLVLQQNAYDLKTIVNPEILGGYILRVGDHQIDASVRTKLAKLKKEFELN